MNGKFNTFSAPLINTIETRGVNGTIQLGLLKVVFAGTRISYEYPNYILAANKQLIADMQQIIHVWIGEKVTKENLTKIADELTPLALKLKL